MMNEMAKSYSQRHPAEADHTPCEQPFLNMERRAWKSAERKGGRRGRNLYTIELLKDSDIPGARRYFQGSSAFAAVLR
jgi:hypothetical protein